MSNYLEEAAQLLRKAADANERENARYPGALANGQERLAGQFAALAAIERGVIPAELMRDILDRINSNH
jgi:hypothetical protein